MMIGTEEARALLQTRLEELTREDALAAEATAPVALEQDSVGRLSRVDAMQLQAMALASQRRREAERNRIEAALRRARDDEFGYCLACGEEIGDARLRLDPAVARCVSCAA
jgi:DnaK suppressor protein